jgi:Concanavalin A-like lectin/glucanases superfamily
MLTNENRAGQHNILSLTNVPAMQGIQVGLNVARLAAWQFNENSGFIETGVTSSWLHVAYTFDGREHSLYVNGQQRAVSAAPGQQQGRVTAARIGTWDPGMEMFRGTLDDMRIYKRALSSDEVRTLFENGD